MADWIAALKTLRKKADNEGEWRISSTHPCRIESYSSMNLVNCASGVDAAYIVALVNHAERLIALAELARSRKACSAQ